VIEAACSDPAGKRGRSGWPVLWKTRADRDAQRAPRHSGLVNSSSPFQDTSLVLIVALFDLLGHSRLRPIRLGDSDHIVYGVCFHRCLFIFFLECRVIRCFVENSATPRNAIEWNIHVREPYCQHDASTWYGFFMCWRHRPRGKGERSVSGPSGSGKSTLIPLHHALEDFRRPHACRRHDLGPNLRRSMKSGAKSAWFSRVSTCFRI